MNFGMLDMEEIISEIILSGGIGELGYLIGEIKDVAMGVLLPILIPSLLFGVAYCFFGYKIYRVLLAISGGLIGGLITAIVAGICFEALPAVFIGFFFGAALFGILSWFIYKVFLFIGAFVFGMTVGLIGGLLITEFKAPVVGIVIGIMLGIVCGVLVIVFERIYLIATTSFKGASTIGLVLALFIVKDITRFPLWNIGFTLLFTVGGFLFQYFFKFGKDNNTVKNVPYVQPQGVYGGVQPQGMNPMLPPAGGMQPQGMGMTARVPMLLGVDGTYKGFEFDIVRTLVFGRDAERCNILYPERTNGISKVQFEIGIGQNGQIYIMDQCSSYGTNVNGSKIENNVRVFLKDGDIVTCGENNGFRVSC